MNKNNNLKKATLNDVKTYNELLARLQTLGESQDKTEEWNEAARQLNEFESGLDWFPEVFEEGGKQGLKDLDGTVIVPARFDTIATCFSRHSMPLDKPVIVCDGGRFGMVKTDGSGEMVLPCEHDRIHVFGFAPQFYVVEDKGRKGMILGDGTELIPQIADAIYEPCNDAVVFDSNGKSGLWSLEDGLYVEPLYDELITEFEEPVIAIRDGIEGFLSAEDGHFISKDDYELDDVPVIGCFA